jgi:hypothetical protein
MVEWINPSEEPDDTSPQIRQCGVDVSFNADGDPYSAVSRSQILDSSLDTTYEAQVVFRISDGIACFEGFTEPDQPSVPHFKTIPSACKQVANIPSVQNVESPEETLGQILALGREIPSYDS